MKITLKNLKAYPAMSAETLCFKATLYINDVKSGEVSNDGHGGAHRYQNRETEKRLADYAAYLPPYECNSMTLHHDADSLIDLEIEFMSFKKDVLRKLSNRLVFSRNDKMGIFTGSIIGKFRIRDFFEEEPLSKHAEIWAFKKEHNVRVFFNALTEGELEAEIRKNM